MSPVQLQIFFKAEHSLHWHLQDKPVGYFIPASFAVKSVDTGKDQEGTDSFKKFLSALRLALGGFANQMLVQKITHSYMNQAKIKYRRQDRNETNQGYGDGQGLDHALSFAGGKSRKRLIFCCHWKSHRPENC
jgi:hypothetical protein